MRRLQAYGPSLMVLLTAAAVLLLGPYAARQFSHERARYAVEQARLNLDDVPALAQLQQSYRDIATVVEPCVVHISAEQILRDREGRERSFASTGSGWIYDADGHVVTNAHVIDGAPRIQVQLHDGDLREATLIGLDRATDIAVIRIPSHRLIPAARTSADMPRQGDVVFAFGSPFEFRFSMSKGIVSGIGRSADLGDIHYQDFIQVDAAINPGNSGGPLTDIRGNVIGMNTAIATGSGNRLGGGQFAGIGLAIPMPMIESVVDQLIATGKVSKGYIGVTLVRDATLDPKNGLQSDNAVALALARQRGLQGQGIAVDTVEDNGPADQAGIKPDDIITQVDGRPIATLAQLRSVISSRHPGDTVSIQLWRYDLEAQRGQTMTIPVTLGTLDTSTLVQREMEVIRMLGLGDLATWTRKDAEAAGREFQPGVIINTVIEGSQMDGIVAPGSIVLAINGRHIASVDEFHLLIGQANLVYGVMLRILTPEGQLDEVPLAYRRPFSVPDLDLE